LKGEKAKEELTLGREKKKKGGSRVFWRFPEQIQKRLSSQAGLTRNSFEDQGRATVAIVKRPPILQEEKEIRRPGRKKKREPVSEMSTRKAVVE